MIRVIVNGVSFYTSKSKLLSGVGDNTDVNAVVRIAYGRMRDEKSKGIATTMVLYDHKMTRKSYDVQIG